MKRELKEMYTGLDRLSKTLPTLIGSLATMSNVESLRESVENAREWWDQHSEQWQEGDDGVLYDSQIKIAETMIENIDAAAKELANIQEQFTELFNEAPEGAFSQT